MLYIPEVERLHRQCGSGYSFRLNFVLRFVAFSAGIFVDVLGRTYNDENTWNASSGFYFE